MTKQPRNFNVNHHVHDVIELEFYIPIAVWDDPATKTFLSEVYALVEGATVLGGAKGVWRGTTESTNLVRVLIRKADIRFDEVLPLLREDADRLMLAWNTDSSNAQDLLMFTVRRLEIHETTISSGSPDNRPELLPD